MDQRDMCDKLYVAFQAEFPFLSRNNIFAGTSGQPRSTRNTMLMQTNGVVSYHQSSPDVASTSYYPTAWYPEFSPTLCLPTPCAPCYTSIDTRLHSFPYPIVNETLTVSVIPYVTVVANGSRITSYLTSTQHNSPGWNATDLAIELFETFTWSEMSFTM